MDQDEPITKCSPVIDLKEEDCNNPQITETKVITPQTLVESNEELILTSLSVENTETDLEQKERHEQNSRPLSKLGGARRKRYVWFMKHGYTKEEALQLSAKRMPESSKMSHKLKGSLCMQCQQPNCDLFLKWSGIRIKKYMWFLKQGHTKEQAIKRSQQPMSEELKQSFKQQNLKKNYPHRKKERGPHRHSVNSIRIGIVPSNFPDQKLKNKELVLIKESISLKIIQEQNNVTLSFHGTTLKHGWLLMICDGRETAEWLHKNISSIKPWEGADLKAVDEEYLPRQKIYIAHFRSCTKYETGEILRYLKAQNKEFNVGRWRIVNRKDKGITIIAFSVDQTEAAKLGNGCFLNFRLGKISIKPSKHGNNKTIASTFKEDAVMNSSLNDKIPVRQLQQWEETAPAIVSHPFGGVQKGAPKILPPTIKEEGIRTSYTISKRSVQQLPERDIWGSDLISCPYRVVQSEHCGAPAPTLEKQGIMPFYHINNIPVQHLSQWKGRTPDFSNYPYRGEPGHAGVSSPNLEEAIRSSSYPFNKISIQQLAEMEARSSDMVRYPHRRIQPGQCLVSSPNLEKEDIRSSSYPIRKKSAQQLPEEEYWASDMVSYRYRGVLSSHSGVSVPTPEEKGIRSSYSMSKMSIQQLAQNEARSSDVVSYPYSGGPGYSGISAPTPEKGIRSPYSISKRLVQQLAEREAMSSDMVNYPNRRVQPRLSRGRAPTLDEECIMPFYHINNMPDQHLSRWEGGKLGIGSYLYSGVQPIPSELPASFVEKEDIMPSYHSNEMHIQPTPWKRRRPDSHPFRSDLPQPSRGNYPRLSRDQRRRERSRPSKDHLHPSRRDRPRHSDISPGKFSRERPLTNPAEIKKRYTY